MAGLQRRPAFSPSVSAKHSIEVSDCVIAQVSALRRNRTRSRWLFPKKQVEFPFVTGDGLSGTLLQKHFGNGSRKFYCTAIMKRLILKNWQIGRASCRERG